PDFSYLFDRMDKDKDLYLLDPYKLKSFDGTDMPKVVSTTLNDPAVFAHRAIAILSSADPQRLVESDTMNATQENDVEQFMEALEYENDARLARMVRGMAFSFFCEQACVRGWLTGASLLREDKNHNLVVDRRPLDSRCVTYEPGLDGLHWGCYKTTRSRRKILDEYGHDIAPEEKIEIRDTYSRTHNQVWIGEDKIRDRLHPFKKPNGDGYVPFVIQPIPTGSMLQDDDVLLHQGESIFALDRAIYPKLNEMVSVLENLT
ncbi:unnamed protein product, partial [marine sediment metagenome]